MLEVGYLRLKSPITVISSRPFQFNGSAGLLILEGFNLDETALSGVESSLKEMGTPSALGISVKGSEETLLEAARFAARNLYLLELDLSGARMSNLFDLVRRIKSCGTTLSVRTKPACLTEDMIGELKEAGLDLIHLDLRGLDGAPPRAVKRASDARGPRIMALDDVNDFEDARSLMAMGADLVSLESPDPEFADWLAGAVMEYDRLSGWYNAPKHICAGGDLRGLSFCCPLVKHCPLMGALKKMGLTPDEFVELKLRLAKGTPLEHGSGTCFGSLVWCCKITKPCYLRDAVLRRLGLSSSEYMELKRRLADQILGP
jgi:putative methanogenesis marker domain 9